MIAMCRKAIPEHRWSELALTGRRATASELQADHVVTACADAPATLGAALDFAATFQKPRAIFGAHKQRMYKGILQVIETEDRPYIEALDLTV
jgi:enoyl-CoA hydratase/carnithine racemase